MPGERIAAAAGRVRWVEAGLWLLAALALLAGLALAARLPEASGLIGLGSAVFCAGFALAARRHARLVQRLRAQARLHEVHFDHTPLGVLEFGADLRIRRWSRRAEKMFGWTEAEVLGRGAEELGLIAPGQSAARRERVARLFGGPQERQSALLGMCHRNGRRLWVEMHDAVTRDAQGRPCALISMALDVTESQEMLRMLNESEARFRSVFNQAAVGIAVLDDQGRWLNVNHRLCEITGYSVEELMDTDFQSITHPDDLERDLLMARAVMDGSLDHYSMEKRYVRKDGRVVWVMLFVRRLRESDGSPGRFVSVVEDISERKEAEARIMALTASLESKVQERTAQLREIIRAGQRRNEELILVTEMGRLLSASSDLGEAAKVVVRDLPRVFPLADGALHLMRADGTGFERAASWGESPLGAQTLVQGQCWALRCGEVHHVEGEPDALHCAHVGDGCRRHPHLCVPVFALGTPVGLVELAWGRAADGWAPEMAMVKAVADTIGLAFGNLKLREELRCQALVDPLTGLHNRRWLDQCLRERAALHARGGRGFAVLMLDVDHFKSVNDSYGHEAGDAALRAVAQAIVGVVRDHEAVARFGGEEFTVVLSEAGPAQATIAAERIRAAVANLQVGGRRGEAPRALSLSVGVARYPEDAGGIEQVLEAADAALYRAKQSGRNRVCVYAPGESGAA